MVDVTWAVAAALYAAKQFFANGAMQAEALFDALFVLWCAPLTYGLTCDGGASLAAKLCRSAALQLLGLLCYSLYLLHELVLLYVEALFFYGGDRAAFHRAASAADTMHNTLQDAYWVPAWLAAAAAALSVLAAWLVATNLEAPARAWLNARSPFAQGARDGGDSR